MTLTLILDEQRLRQLILALSASASPEAAAVLAWLDAEVGRAKTLAARQ